MKSLKTTTFLLLCIFPLLLLSCENATDREDNLPTTLLEGTWQLSKTEGWKMYNGTKREFSENHTSDFEYMQFYPDGSGVHFFRIQVRHIYLTGL